jgi:uncharacterized repeat protein (TIGR01451 family)
MFRIPLLRPALLIPLLMLMFMAARDASPVAAQFTYSGEASFQTPPPQPADVGITQSTSGSAFVGQPLRFRITVTNDGPATATNVVMTDVLDSNVSFDSVTTSQGTCTHANGTVTCNLGSVAPQGQVLIDVTVRPKAAGRAPNQPTVTADQPDPDQANNTAPRTNTIVLTSADLGITKSANPDPVRVGETLTYTLTVTNAGASAATGVSVADDLPDSVTFLSVAASQGNCGREGDRVLCDIDTIQPNAQPVTITITVRPTTAGSITNTAEVAGDETDHNEANNTASVTTTVEAPAADLKVTKTASPAMLTPGAELTYTVTVENLGPSPATNTVLTDPIPAGVALRSVSTTRGACTPPNPPQPIANATVSCQLGTLERSAAETVTIKVVAQAEGPVTNTATVRAAEPDPNPANNSAAATATVCNARHGCGTVTPPTQPPPAGADMQVAKTASVSTAQQGGEVTYTLSVRNNGPATATNVTVDDQLPGGLTLVNGSIQPGGASCAQSTDLRVRCVIKSLAAGAAAVEIRFRVTATPAQPGPITNTATVTATQQDANPNNNQSSVTVTVTAPTCGRGGCGTPVPNPTPPAGRPDLEVWQAAFVDGLEVKPGGTVPAGAEITFTLLVRNKGTAPATNVLLLDALTLNNQRANVTIVRAFWQQIGGAAEQECVIFVSDQGVRCDLGTVPVTSPRGDAFSIHVKVKASQAGALRSTAVAILSETDANDSDNTNQLAVQITSGCTSRCR